MKAVILAAGYGTRLQRDVLADSSGRFAHLAGVAKPLLPVGRCALISHWVHALTASGSVDCIYVVVSTTVLESSSSSYCYLLEYFYVVLPKRILHYSEDKWRFALHTKLLCSPQTNALYLAAFEEWAAQFTNVKILSDQTTSNDVNHYYNNCFHHHFHHCHPLWPFTTILWLTNLKVQVP